MFSIARTVRSQLQRRVNKTGRFLLAILKSKTISERSALMKQVEGSEPNGSKEQQACREQIASSLAFLVVRAHRQKQTDLVEKYAEKANSDNGPVAEANRICRG